MMLSNTPRRFSKIASILIAITIALPMVAQADTCTCRGGTAPEDAAGATFCDLVGGVRNASAGTCTVTGDIPVERCTSAGTSRGITCTHVVSESAAPAGSCRCTCTIQTATSPETVSMNVMGVGTATGPATLAETQSTCQTLCQTQSTNRSGTSFTATLGTCPASLFPSSSTDTGSTGSGGSVALFNPLGTDMGVAEFISRALRTVIGFVGALALLMFVYGGVMWMTAGDSKRIDTAKEILKNSTIGLLLIFFSYSIVSIVFSLLGTT
ncbi:pilin [Candidatus Uhrbacteria bacterium]|nr:pilin [Candidatus Uhrbacteria bacterium]